MSGVVAMVLSLVLVGTVSAQESELPEPGLTPDSPLYFLDSWGEGIGLALTQDSEVKARKQIRISQEKLAEAKVMGEKGDAEAAEIASNRYGEMINGAAENVAVAAQSGEGVADAVADLLATTAAISQSVLADVYERVPEQAKASIQRAMEESSAGISRAVDAVSGAQQEQVRERVNESLQKARESAPEEAQQYIPANQGGESGSDNAPDVGGSDAGSNANDQGGAPANIPGR